MRENSRLKNSKRRQLLLQSLGLLGSSAFVGTATARSQEDERADIDRTFTKLRDKHGQPTLVGQKRFTDGKTIASGNAPENAVELFANNHYDLASATKYAFEDGVKKTVAIGTNSEDLMVYLDDKYFVTSITGADRQAIVSSLEHLNSKMGEQRKTALQARYSSDKYGGAGQ